MSICSLVPSPCLSPVTPVTAHGWGSPGSRTKLLFLWGACFWWAETKFQKGGHRWVIPSTGGRRGLVIHSFMDSDRDLQKSLEDLVPVRIIWWGWFIWLLAMGKVIPDEYCYEGPRIRFVHPQILAVLRKWVGDEVAGRGYGGNYQIKKVHIRWNQGAQCQDQKNLSPNWSREI